MNTKNLISALIISMISVSTIFAADASTTSTTSKKTDTVVVVPANKDNNTKDADKDASKAVAQ